MDYLVIFKLIAVPVVILITVFLSKKYGAFIGSLLAGLPVFSGPISFFITLEQGTDFAILSSYNSLIGLLGCVVTSIIYSWIAYWGGKWWIALPCAIVGYFINGYLFHFLPEFSFIVIILACSSSFFITYILPKGTIENYSTKRPRWILLFQMLSGAFLVYIITELAHILGPQWSGIVSCFPIMITALAPFAHAGSGVYAMLVLMRGLAVGWIGTALFACTVIVMVQHYHIAIVYLTAIFVACASSILYTILYLYFKKKYSLT